MGAIRKSQVRKLTKHCVLGCRFHPSDGMKSLNDVTGSHNRTFPGSNMQYESRFKEIRLGARKSIRMLL